LREAITQLAKIIPESEHDMPEAHSGLRSDIAPCPKSADAVEKVFSG
jgi:hypothetical protein